MIPLVVLSQHYVQLRYPSDLLKDKRVLMTWLHALPCAGMSLTFACTDIVHSVFPSAHETLRWGGHSSETWQVLIVCFVVMLDFYLTMPERSVFLAHVLTFGSVIGTLWATEGTLALGSKWCTYCLIFSFVSATDPIWGPGPGKRARAKAPAQSRREGLRSGATPLKTKGA